MGDNIHFILTGGTIDAYFDPVQATTVPNTESVIPDYFKNIIKSHEKITFETLFLKDSRDLTPGLRQEIIGAVERSDSDKIIIAHGTDAMVETADFLAQNYKGFHDKTIILTGAFYPLKQFVKSDGGFNLGFAVASVQNLAAGVYICMNARVFPAGKVRKNRPAARFEENE